MRSVEVVDTHTGHPVAQMVAAGVTSRGVQANCRNHWRGLGYSECGYMFRVLPGQIAARVTEHIINRNGIRRCGGA